MALGAKVTTTLSSSSMTGLTLLIARLRSWEIPTQYLDTQSRAEKSKSTNLCLISTMARKIWIAQGQRRGAEHESESGESAVRLPARPARWDEVSAPTLATLQRRARRATSFRGHRMAWTETIQSCIQHGACVRCGKWVRLHTTPEPGQIDIGGPAVALRLRANRRAERGVGTCARITAAGASTGQAQLGLLTHGACDCARTVRSCCGE